jgi:Fuc2NAc and GlcNAc transferase
MIGGGVLCAAASWMLTGVIRRAALQHGVLDVPGHRSLHAEPTPRGGGLAIGVSVLTGIALLAAVDLLAALDAAVLLGGALLVMAAGWLDDVRSLPVGPRALAYGCAALIAVAGIAASAAVIPQWWWLGAAVLAIAWLTNLYNFMDGSDGLAAIETITAGAAAAWLLFGQNAGGAAWICWLLCCASAGFLAWNWPPARIFMGDAGSCLIGFLFGATAVLAARDGTLPPAAWAILLAVFWVDATATLLRRLLRGEPWYSPHRSHAYQLLVLSGMSHRQLAISVATVNLALLAPLAWLSLQRPQWSAACLAGAVAALLAAWFAVQRRHAEPRP